MVYALIAGELLLLVAAAFLVRFLMKQAINPARTAVLGGAFVVAAFVATAVIALGSVNFRIPVGWLIGMAASAAITVVLAIMLGREVRWRVAGIVAGVMLFMIGSTAFGAIMTANLWPEIPRALYDARMQQIADAYGFTPFVPADERLPTDMLPVEAVSAREAMVLSYQPFRILERQADEDEPSADELRAVLAAGEAPFGDIEVPDHAEYTDLDIQGRPAAGVEFESQGPATMDSAKRETVAMLAVVLDGTLVVMSSNAYESLIDGEWVPFEAVPVVDLARTADRLERLD